MLINKETLFGDSTERKVQRENMLLIHLFTGIKFSVVVSHGDCATTGSYMKSKFDSVP